MKVLFYIGHPAHVHLFRNAIRELEKRGHSAVITSSDKEVALNLLDAYGFKYINLGKNRKGLINKALRMLGLDYRLYQIGKKYRVDMFVSAGAPYAAHASKLLGKPAIAFDDTEHSTEQYQLYAPFVDAVCTPSCFRKDLGKKQVRYDGYHELAYLHPNQFKPNPKVLDELELGEGDRFFVLRFVSWRATHDIGQKGLDTDAKLQLVRDLKKHGRVYITSEVELTKDLEGYRLTTPPEKIHDLLYYATMYVGEGATMATEAGLLGTPSVYISSLSNTMGNYEELEKRYGLVYSFNDAQKGIDAALDFLKNKDLKADWQKKREKMLSEKIDVTKWMTDFIEDYPESFREYVRTHKRE